MTDGFSIVDALLLNPVQDTPKQRPPSTAGRNDFLSRNVSALPISRVEKEAIRGFSFSEAFKQGMEQSFFLENFIAPQEYRFFTGGDTRDFRERQLETIQKHMLTHAPAGVVENIEEFIAANLGRFVGSLSDPVAVLGMALVGASVSAVPVPAVVAGAGLVGNSLGRFAIEGATLGAGFAGVEQSRKVAQNIVAKKAELLPDTRAAAIEGFFGGFLGAGLSLGGRLGKGGVAEYLKSKNALHGTDSTWVPSTPSEEAYNGEFNHSARAKETITGYSENVWRDSAGNIYDNTGAKIANHDSALAEGAAGDVPLNTQEWESVNMRYDVMLGTQFEKLTGEIQEGIREKTARQEKSLEAKERKLKKLKQDYPLEYNEYTQALEVNRDLYLSRVREIEIAEQRLEMLKKLKEVGAIEEELNRRSAEFEAVRQAAVEEGEAEIVKRQAAVLEEARKKYAGLFKDLQRAVSERVERRQQTINQRIKNLENNTLHRIKFLKEERNKVQKTLDGLQEKLGRTKSPERMELLKSEIDKKKRELRKRTKSVEIAERNLTDSLADRHARGKKEIEAYREQAAEAEFKKFVKRVEKDEQKFVEAMFKEVKEGGEAIGSTQQELYKKFREDVTLETKEAYRAELEELKNTIKEGKEFVESSKVVETELTQARGELDEQYSLRREELLQSIEALEASLEGVEKLSLKTMTDLYHQRASKKYTDLVLDMARESPDKITFLKNFIDSLITAGELEKGMKAQLKTPLSEVLNKHPQSVVDEFVKDSTAQKNAINVYLGKAEPRSAIELDVANMFRETALASREAQLSLGFNIGYVEDYLPVQFKDPVKIIESGYTKERFVDELKRGLDWERMGFVEEVEGGGAEVVSAARQEEYLGRVWEEIMNNDFTRPLTTGHGHTSEFARRNRARTFHYGDTDMMFNHMKAFSGTDNVLEAVSMHTNSVANRLTQHATLGISPVETAEILRKQLPPILEGKPDGTKNWQKFFSSPFYRISSMDSLLNEVAKTYSWHNEGGFMTKLYTMTNMLTTSRLGGIGVYALEDVERTFLASKRFKFLLKDFFKDVFTPTGVNKEAASWLGLLLDDVRQVVPDEVHMTKSGAKSRKFSEFIYKWSGATFLTNRLKVVTAKQFYRNVGKFLDGEYATIPDTFKKHLDRYGLTPGDWERLKKLDYTRKVDGIKLYSPRDVFKLENPLDRQAVMKLNQAMYGFMADGIVEANRFRSATLMGNVPNRDTILGYVANSFKTFTGAPTSLSYNLLSSPLPGARIAQEFTLVMMVGALMGLTRDITKGQRPAWEDFEGRDIFRYALESYKMGGGFGILSDYILATMIATLSERPTEAFYDEFTKTVAGAGAGMVKNVGGDIAGILNAIITAENPNIVTRAEKYIPNLPGLEILTRRLLTNSLKELVGEDVFLAEERIEAMRERQKKVGLFE